MHDSHQHVRVNRTIYHDSIIIRVLCIFIMVGVGGT